MRRNGKTLDRPISKIMRILLASSLLLGLACSGNAYQQSVVAKYGSGDAEIDQIRNEMKISPTNGRDAMAKRTDPKDAFERPAYKIDASAGFFGFQRLLDHEGYHGSKPPWGKLNAIDLNTGKIKWQIPFGEYEGLTDRGLPLTGTENLDGATVTAGGLVFARGARDRKIKAYDPESGPELWAYTLPYGGSAAPTVYQAHGSQYIVVPATGGGKLRMPAGDAFVALRLVQDKTTQPKGDVLNEMEN